MPQGYRVQSMIILLVLCAGYALSQSGTPPSNSSPTPTMADINDSPEFVGDGRTDNTATIQRAVDSGVGCIRFSKGTYRITQPIVIDLDRVGYTSFAGDCVATIVMAGPGPALKFVGTHFQSADPGGFSDDVWQRQRMPSVDGLAIRGDHSEAIGIQAAGTMQLTVTRCHIRGVLHGIHLVENNRNVIVSECQIYENRGVGVYYDDVNLHQSNITGCHISYCAGGGVVSRAGNVRNIHISGCDLESNMSSDTAATANVMIDCAGSPYGTAEVAITGCTIQHNNPSPDSANIRILGRSDSKEEQVVREGNVTITGNVLSDVQVNVHLKDCRGVAVTGNTFWQGYRHSLLVEDCQSIVVGPNNFDRNPRYNYGNNQDANNGLVFRNSQDCTLTGLHVTNVWRESAGLLIEDCRRFNITNCTILDCDNAGLLLRNVSDSRVSDCLIRDDRLNRDDHSGAEFEPIVIDGGQRNMVVDNLVGKERRH